MACGECMMMLTVERSSADTAMVVKTWRIIPFVKGVAFVETCLGGNGGPVHVVSHGYLEDRVQESVLSGRQRWTEVVETAVC